MAAGTGHEVMVMLLVEQGADVNFNNGNSSVLHQAVYDNNETVVSFLLDRGANVNITDNDGNPPLEWASRKDQDGIAMMALLLKRGADIHKLNNLKNSALHLCVKENRFAAARFLLEHGANYQVKNWQNQTPLELAEASGKHELFELKITSSFTYN